MKISTLALCALVLLPALPGMAAAPPPKTETADSIKAGMKDEFDKLKAQQKDQRDKLKTEQKQQTAKLKAEQKYRWQRFKAGLAINDSAAPPARTDSASTLKSGKTASANP
jgi:hypothetical protein